jgi:shikimate kinase
MTGFMGSGKTTVGKGLAERLRWRFVDLDAEVERMAGTDIPTLFGSSGEEGFRRWEQAALKSLIGGQRDGGGLVLALGGGTLVDPANAALMKGAATVVYLQIDGETAWRRVEGSDRPLAKDRQRFVKLLEARRRSYEEAADVIIYEAEETPERLVDRVVVELAARGIRG